MIKKPRIGLISSPGISPNENAELHSLGRMVGKEFDLHLLCGENADCNGLKKYYAIHCGTAYRKDVANFCYAFNVCNIYVKTLNLDLLMNVCSPATIGFAATFFTSKYSIPGLIRMTGDSFGEARLHSHPWKRIKSWILHGHLASLAFKRADYILAIGENLKAELLRRHFNPDKIFVLPQPFDQGLFTPVNATEKLQKKIELGLNPNRKTIIFAGRLCWLKGADRILKIVGAVSTRSTAFQFCLVGKGEYRNDFKRFSSDMVFLPGLVPHSDVSRYFQAADLLIFPSRTEGLPNTVLEALSCKVPVIAAPVGDISNWVSKIATEPEDYVEYILKGNYVLDELPDILEYDRLKAAYIDFFHKVITDK
jgi:glycosyltransferase involved in cell wall biosynthesis